MLRAPLILVCLGVATLARADGPATPPAAPKCTAPEYRQFDFWVGDWDAYDTGETTPSARAHIDLIAGGCAIHELYEQTDGLIGDSILSYDAVKKSWQQTWVTNRGGFMYLTGAFKDGGVTLEGESHMRDGKTVRMRITWQGEGANVREFAVASTDGGKQWVPAFDVTFKKRKAAVQ